MKIKNLTLYTQRLEDQINFYNKNLQLELLKETSNSAEFKVGDTILKFVFHQNATPYHFAIAIPPHKEKAALEWIKPRVKIIEKDGEEIVDYKSWNARSIYFYDNDNNVVELISRSGAKINSNESFDETDLLAISEIGLAVDDIEKIYYEISDVNKTPIYDGDFNEFCAVGDEEGLLILINKNKKSWFPANDPAFSSDLIIGGDFNLEFAEGHAYANCL